MISGRNYEVSGKKTDTKGHDEIVGLKMEEIVTREDVLCVTQKMEKVLPILGALHGKLFNTLITDERTAMNVLIRGGEMI